MLHLVGGLALPRKRATAISIVLSGLILGSLLARVISGVIAEYSNWRNVYWLSLGVQYLHIVLLWLFMPDYPLSHPDGLNYSSVLWSIVKTPIHEPLLVQTCIVAFFTAAVFTSYWTTLTFLLSSPTYNYSSLAIGLFALMGIASLFLGPAYSAFVMGKFVPLASVIFGELLTLFGVIIGRYTGTLSVVTGLVFEAVAIDMGLQLTQLAGRATISPIAPLAQNRINTVYSISIFCGQLMGTAVGNRLYAKGGWILCGSARIGFVAVAILACFVRGPQEDGWIGWRGGWCLKPDGLQEKLDEESRGRTRHVSIVSVKAPRISDVRVCDSAHRRRDSEKWLEQIARVGRATAN